MHRNPSRFTSGQSSKRGERPEEYPWHPHVNPRIAYLLDQGLGDLWDRTHAGDDESTRHRAIAEIVGEMM